MKKITSILITVLIGLSSCVEEPETHSNSYVGNFEALWSIIDTRYCFLDYKEIDWEAVHEEYREKLNYVSNKYQYFDLMADMLRVLQDGHVNLYSDFDVSRDYDWYSDSIKNFDSDIIYSDNYLGYDYRIAGGLHYKKLKGGEIGYIYYSSFSNAFSDQNMKNVFTIFAGCKGLIIDIRNNGGGNLTNAEKLASYFFDETRITGYMQHKNGTGHSDFSAPAPIKTPANSKVNWLVKPVAILTNRRCYSATNDFVNRMRSVPHAFTVGSWTGGGGGMPLSSELPVGWMVRFSACPILDADMQQTENGFAPDYWVALQDEDKLRDIDTVIETAIRLIEEKTR
jgi:hypothetical protein